MTNDKQYKRSVILGDAVIVAGILCGAVFIMLLATVFMWGAV